MERPGKTLEPYKEWENKGVVQKLYNLLHPDGKFKGDYVQACISIRKELRKSCLDGKLDIILVVSRTLGMDIGPSEDSVSLCKRLLNRVVDTCLNLGEDISSRVALNYSLNVIPPTYIDSEFDVEPSKCRGSVSPIMVSNNMRDFLRNGNFGLSDPEDPESRPLNEILMVGYNGISTRHILIILFSIYVRINGMQDPIHKSFLRTTPEMYQYLSPILDKIERDDRSFNRKKFAYYKLQLLISKGIKSKIVIEDSEILTRLNKELAWMIPLF